MGEGFLLAVVRLGLPVIALFGAGYLLRRHRARVEEMFSTVDLAWRPQLAAGNPCGAGQPAACWQLMACPLAARDACPAYNRTYMPCWLAKKLASGGHLREQCLSCAL